MKKLYLSLWVLGMLAIHASAVQWDWYGGIYTGFYGMKTYRWWNDTIKNQNDFGADPYPTMYTDFLARGTLGATAQGSWYNAVVEMGLSRNGYDYTAGKIGGSGDQFLFKKFSDFAYLKKWYMQLLFRNDALRILAGQDFSPTCFFPSEQSFYGGNSFGNVGCLYTSRRPQLKLTASFLDARLESEFAAIMVDTTNLRIRQHSSEGVNGDTALYYSEVRVPKLEGSLKWSVFGQGGKSGFSGKVAGGFQRYYQSLISLDDKNSALFPTGWEKFPVDAYLIGADLGFTLGELALGEIKLNLDAFWGQNIGTYGAYIGDAFGRWFDSRYMLTLIPIHDFQPTTGRNRFLNCKLLEVASILSYKPARNLVFEGGTGTVGGFFPNVPLFSELSGHEDSTYTAEWSPTYAWYAQARYTIRDMFTLIPEIGFFDYGPRWGFGKYTYWGLTTFIEFKAESDK